MRSSTIFIHVSINICICNKKFLLRPCRSCNFTGKVLLRSRISIVLSLSKTKDGLKIFLFDSSVVGTPSFSGINGRQFRLSSTRYLFLPGY